MSEDIWVFFVMETGQEVEIWRKSLSLSEKSPSLSEIGLLKVGERGIKEDRRSMSGRHWT